mmetsp:Transcript_706/g.987  ORF Transcript_706/g.987 Transcript_706/m.987 type:complete len:171 (-) Transcript_706:72-584(-)
MGICFSQDLDFMTKFFIILVLASLIYLSIYLLMPMMIRRKLELIDYNPSSHSVSWSAGISIMMLSGLILFKLQKMSISKTPDQKAHEDPIERNFRHRQQFMSDIHTYLFVMLLGIWLTINFVFKVNRARESCQAYIEGRAPDASAVEPATPVEPGTPTEPPKKEKDKKDD